MTSITVESWIWYGVVIVVVATRLYEFKEYPGVHGLLTHSSCSTARLFHFKSILRLQVEDWFMLFLTVGNGAWEDPNRT